MSEVPAGKTGETKLRFFFALLITLIIAALVIPALVKKFYPATT